jgi:hypothetical protein
MAAGRGGRLVGGRLPWLVTLLALVATAAWAVPVVLTRSHGFDISDEGSYVLAYRWWDADTRNFTGAQYLYGPLFEAVGYSIGALRLIRLATVLGAHLLFGWAFVSWLRTRYPSALPSRAWAAAAVSCVVAVGGMTYGWLPLSPGYNDVVALGCLALMAAFFRSWRAVLRSGRLAVGPALALPVPLLAMLLAKWSSTVVVVAFLGVVFVVVALALRPRGWGRFVGAGLASTVAVVLLFDVLVEPLGSVVPPLIEVNRLAAGSSHTAGKLLDLYVSSTLDILGLTGTLMLIVAVLGLVGLLVARTGMRTAAAWVVAAGPVMVVGAVGALGSRPWPEGGDVGLADYSAALVALVAAGVVAFVVALVRSRASALGPRPGNAWELAGVVSMLVLLPVVQAVGSGNSLSSLAVNLAACWFAFILLGIAAARSTSSTRWFMVSTATAVLVLCASVGADGVLEHPYRTTAYNSSDRALGGTGTLAGVAMSARDRTQLAAVRRAMTPASQGRRPVVALDEIAGLILLTEGRPLGEPWSSALAPERLAAGIRAACRHEAWSGANEPVVIAWRQVPGSVTDALDGCGVHLDGGTYREVRLPAQGRTVRIFTPRS